jgi:NAD(P)H-dependent flavin oxidoreductase YrpB (nitropropane dioxygenase family)
VLSTPFTDLLGGRLPLQQAPMGGVTTPELVAAVAGAGAVGMVPAQMLPAEALAGLLADLAGRADGVVGVHWLAWLSAQS